MNAAPDGRPNVLRLLRRVCQAYMQPIDEQRSHEEHAQACREAWIELVRGAGCAASATALLAWFISRQQIAAPPAPPRATPTIAFAFALVNGDPSARRTVRLIVAMVMRLINATPEQVKWANAELRLECADDADYARMLRPDSERALTERAVVSANDWWCDGAGGAVAYFGLRWVLRNLRHYFGSDAAYEQRRAELIGAADGLPPL